MTHQVTKKENGKYAIMRIASGCAYGEYETKEEAESAIVASGHASKAATTGVEHY